MATKTYLYKRADGDKTKRAKLTDVTQDIADNTSGVTPETPSELNFNIIANQMIIRRCQGSVNETLVGEDIVYTTEFTREDLGLTEDDSILNYVIVAICNSDNSNKFKYPFNKILSTSGSMNISASKLTINNTRELMDEFDIAMMKKR